MLGAFAEKSLVTDALQIFHSIRDSPVASWNAIVTTLARDGQLGVAKDVFDSIPAPDVISWTSLADGFAKNGEISRAKELFDRMPERNSVSWNAMLDGFASNGRFGESVELLWAMSAEGFIVDEGSFTSILSACARSGSVERTCQWLRSMGSDYALAARVEHYSAVIDALGKSGAGLKLAEEMLLANPLAIDIDVVAWRSLLGSSVAHRSGSIGARAGNKAVSLEPANGAAYVLGSCLASIE
ncbi:hypothetical protein SELMODRAFT_100795 [Selaginella moellendorffii]|uniref:Pentacotripeptide-repeat region of PRORP domain-containing protein n=1 Tax=Selaginella moellendorffii TaxID=88036 RepID=D8RRU0_SELML|nr:hypothetical protein SELMODRAFT_100795 [Selaginella moellendorffii]